MRRGKHPALRLIVLAFCCLVGTTYLAEGPVQAQEWKREQDLPSFYDSRQNGKKPCIKSQGELPACWAISCSSALEAARMPEEQTVYSADHLLHQSGFSGGILDGGDFQMIMAYLSGWYGPVAEEDDPYGDGESPEGLTASLHVQDMRLLLQPDEELVKEMICTFGPVQSSLYMNRQLTKPERGYYQDDYASYLYPTPHRVDHDVLILGWDDSFPAEYFSYPAARDGAWICQNTWGEEFGEQGIFYVSYEDANLTGKTLVYQRVDLPDNYDRIYQQDQCGWQGRLGYDRETVYEAAVYTAEMTETLRAVGLYTTGEESRYEISLVREFEDPRQLSEARQLQSGELTGMGYHTIDLNSWPEMEPGERFALVVRLDTKGETKPLAVEIDKNQYTRGVSLEGKEGYVSPDGQIWSNIQDMYQANLCLKVYTVEHS
ncbi:MAG: lectin like domain-containing protein [Lachnospiraceae bacterium]|nr:lectin like domain-containing protein [Lachnospiraceae bacterium]